MSALRAITSWRSLWLRDRDDPERRVGTVSLRMRRLRGPSAGPLARGVLTLSSSLAGLAAEAPFPRPRPHGPASRPRRKPRKRCRGPAPPFRGASFVSEPSGSARGRGTGASRLPSAGGGATSPPGGFPGVERGRADAPFGLPPGLMGDTGSRASPVSPYREENWATSRARLSRPVPTDTTAAWDEAWTGASS
jgi:hypothetical protein